MVVGMQITLYTLSLHNVICQLHLNKAGDKRKNKIRMQKEMLKANKPPGLLCLYNSNGLNVKSNVMGIP